MAGCLRARLRDLCCPERLRLRPVLLALFAVTAETAILVPAARLGKPASRQPHLHHIAVSSVLEASERPPNPVLP